jgi:hypothetical protein
MLEKFVESKIKIERARIDKYDDITRGDIRKSHLPAPIKRYILARFEGNLSDSEFTALLTKAIKLNINYTIRPGWTLLNFLFSKYDSQQSEIIKEKSDVFTFYRFYIDFIVNYIDEHSLVVVTKDKITRFIKEANRALHEKLVENISGVKVKNFFIQLYRLAEKNQEDVSLTSTVPFLFIKTFLEDKEYDDILQKFNSVTDLTNETEISLKDCIKVVSDKFAPQSSSPEKLLEESTDIFPDEEKEEENEEVEVEIEEQNTTEIESEVDDKIENENDREISIKIHDENDGEDDQNEKNDNDVASGVGVIDVEFGDSDDAAEVERGNNPVITDDDEDGGDESAHDRDSVRDRVIGDVTDSRLPTEVISESNLDIEKKSISRLFKHGELVSICQAVYNGDKQKMHESFRALKEFTEWKDASEYIKEYFYDNNVDIYNKSVLLFIDVLNDYYNQLDGN